MVKRLLKAILPGGVFFLFGIFGCTVQTPSPEVSLPSRPAQAVPMAPPPEAPLTQLAPPSEIPSAQLPTAPEPSQESAVAPPPAPAIPETSATPPPAEPTKPSRPSPSPRKPASPPLVLSAAPKLILIPETKDLFFAVVPDRDLDLFFSRAEMRYYYHRKGRWYSTRYYSGPWSPVEPQELPEDLQKASPMELKARILPLLLKRPGG